MEVLCKLNTSRSAGLDARDIEEKLFIENLGESMRMGEDSKRETILQEIGAERGPA